MQNAVEEKNMTKEDAVELALEIERTESALKKMKDDLKKYVEENGELQAGAKVWRFDQSVSWKFDADGLKKVAEGLVLDGHNPWEYLNITPANVKKLNWDEKILAKIGKKSVNNRFVSRKV